MSDQRTEISSTSPADNESAGISSLESGRVSKSEVPSGDSPVPTGAAPAPPQPHTTPDDRTAASSTAAAGTTTALAIWDNVPNTPVPDLTVLSSLPFDDLLSAAKKMWTFGRIAHDVVVAFFRQIMDRYDGRQATRPPMKVEEAFASIGVNYEAARKLVYRDRKKRDLEAIAASLHLPSASTPATSIFHIRDEVTIADGDGVIEHVHQTTGKIDIVLNETQELATNVDTKHVTKLNGAPIIDGKLAKQKEHLLAAGEMLIDAASGKKWIYADGKFSMTKMLSRSEVKEEANARLQAERDAARKRKEEEKKVRQEQASNKEEAKIKAAKAKREAAQAKREAKRAAAADKAAKAAAAKTKKPPKVSSARGAVMTAKKELVKVARIGETQEFGVFPETATQYTTDKVLKIGTRDVCEAERDRINTKRQAQNNAVESAVGATNESLHTGLQQNLKQHPAAEALENALDSTEPVAVGDEQRDEDQCDYTEEDVAEMFAAGGND